MAMKVWIVEVVTGILEGLLSSTLMMEVINSSEMLVFI